MRSFQMAESDTFEVTEVLCLLLRDIRLSLRDRRSIDHGKRHSEYRQHRCLGWKRLRLERAHEYVDRETRTFHWFYRSVLHYRRDIS